MVLYTGYFARTGVYVDHNLLPVSISASVPDGFDFPAFKSIAPSWDLVHQYKDGLISVLDYTREYLGSLSEVSVNAVLEDCKNYLQYSKRDGIVFCCWEAPDKFCHRHLLADYIKDNFDIVVEEYKI